MKKAYDIKAIYAHAMTIKHGDGMTGGFGAFFNTTDTFEDADLLMMEQEVNGELRIFMDFCWYDSVNVNWKPSRIKQQITEACDYLVAGDE